MEKNTSTNSNEVYLNAARQLVKMPIYEISLKIRRLKISQYVFEKNCEALLNHIDYFEQEDSLWDINNREKMDLAHAELVRLLHNWLASKESLVEHSRKFIKGLNNAKLQEENIQQIESLKGLTNFLTDMRAHVLHSDLIYPMAVREWTNIASKSNFGNTKTTINFKKRDLLKYCAKKESREYVENQSEIIYLKKIVKDYKNLVEEYYGWLNSRIQELYKKEFEEMEILIRKIR